MSKGSKRRPQKVADKQLEMNWKQIFKSCGLKEVKLKKKLNFSCPSIYPIVEFNDGSNSKYSSFAVPERLVRAKHKRKKKEGRK